MSLFTLSFMGFRASLAPVCRFIGRECVRLDRRRAAEHGGALPGFVLYMENMENGFRQD